MTMLYFIYLFDTITLGNGDYVESKRTPDGELHVGGDWTFAKGFENPNDAQSFASENGIAEGEYAIHGFFVK